MGCIVITASGIITLTSFERVLRNIQKNLLLMSFGVDQSLRV